MLTHYFFCFCLAVSLLLRFRVVSVGWSWRRRWKPAPVPMTTTPGAARGTPAVGAGRCCKAWATTTQLTAVSVPLELLYNGRLQRCVFGRGCCRVIKKRMVHIALVTAFDPSKPNLLFVFVYDHLFPSHNLLWGKCMTATGAMWFWLHAVWELLCLPSVWLSLFSVGRYGQWRCGTEPSN